MTEVNENIIPEIPDTKDAPKPGTKDALKAELEAALKEIEELKAAAAKNDDAETKSDAPAAAEEERVEIFVPKGYANDEPNLMISVNGVAYLLPRGKKSTVPKHIAEEFNRSLAAQEILDNRVDKMLKAASK